jgi:hypothetical protein
VTRIVTRRPKDVVVVVVIVVVVILRDRYGSIVSEADSRRSSIFVGGE